MRLGAFLLISISWWVSILALSRRSSTFDTTLGGGRIEVIEIVYLGLILYSALWFRKGPLSIRLRSVRMSVLVQVAFLLALILIAALNTLVSAKTAKSFGFRLMMPALVGFAVTSLPKSAKELSRCLDVLKISGTIFTVYSFAATLADIPLFFGRSGALVCLASTLAWAEVLDKSQKKVSSRIFNWVTLICAAIYFLVIDLDQGSELLSFLASLGVTTLFIRSRGAFPKALRYVSYIAGPLLLIAVSYVTFEGLIAPYYLGGATPEWLASVLDTVDETDSNLMDRFDRWQVPIGYIKQDPLRLEFIDFTQEEYINSEGIVSQAAVHDIFLQMGASATVLSPVLMISLLGIFAISGFSQCRHGAMCNKRRALTAVVIAGTLGNLAADSILSHYWAVYFWIAAAASIRLKVWCEGLRPVRAPDRGTPAPSLAMASFSQPAS